MRCLCLLITVGFLLFGFGVKAEEGKDIFESLRCGSCHKVDIGKATPSPKEIAQAYKGKENQLQSYLKGEADPIVNPEKGGMMKRYVEKTKALKEGERNALADFILSHKD
jgi:cytochrome c551/c552